MKLLSIVLTCALLGVMGWLVLDSRSEAKGAKNQLELLRQQQGANPANARSDAQIAAIESQLLADQARQSTPAGSVPPTLPPATTPSLPPALGSSPRVSAAIEAANAAPLPQTPRQRLILAAPVLANVKQYVKDYGFVEIGAGSGRKIEAGMGFAIRRDNAIIARIKVTEVENESAVADVDARSLTPGVVIEPGDEVIQDLPPEL